ncbi:MAG TPA: hypothetical protein PKE01_04580 [Rhodocyclaceae bacterium]|nr:hypothetical protein [Rhodocyclaceae bacterium]
MDSNGTRFLLLDRAADFRNAGGSCAWDADARAFTLVRHDEPRLPRLAAADALQAWADAGPWILDDYGQIARLSADRRSIEAAVGWPDAPWNPLRAHRDPTAPLAADLEALTLDPVDAPTACAFTDLHLGGSGLVAASWMADDGTRAGVTLVHLRARWQRHLEIASPEAPAFRPVRLWVDASDRVWVASDTHLTLTIGAPLDPPYVPRPDRFEPVSVEPSPPRVRWAQALPPLRRINAIAVVATRLLILAEASGSTDGAPQQILLVRALSDDPTAALTALPLPTGLPFASDIAALDDGRAILLPPLETGVTRAQRRDCPVITLDDPPALAAERWPRRSEAAVRFVRHRDNQVRHLANDGVVRLFRLAQARFLPHGRALLTPVFDAGTPDTVWDRLILDACIPAGCSVMVEAQAADTPGGFADTFHRQPLPLALTTPDIPFATPRGTLHEILLQRSSGAARELRGRYLRLRLTLGGDGRHSPAVYALRIWYPRFSWQAHYLPDHFHQQQPADPEPVPAGRAANGADLRERLFASFSGLLTPIEDRIAASEQLLDPLAVPAPWLANLAAMLGTRLRPHWPEIRQRRWLAALGRLQPHKGSYGALCQALDILTEGGVSRGEVVPVELFRLRRTLATVLGLSMDDARHPLTLGTGQSGNSLVGDTLVLSEDHAVEILALFAPELARPGTERQAVEHFFDRYARRLTVILHGPAQSLRGVIEEALPELVPAIVQWNVLVSEHPFVLGLSPLLRIDTYLETQPPPKPVRLDTTRLGRGDLIYNPVALLPEQAGSLPPPESEGDRA